MKHTLFESLLRVTCWGSIAIFAIAFYSLAFIGLAFVSGCIGGAR